MFKVIKRSDCPIHKVTDKQTAFNYITKEISPEVSFIVVKNVDSDKEYINNYQRIYYILSGEMKLEIDDNVIVLEEGDTCLIEKGSRYKASGTYDVIVVNQPAYGTSN